MDRRVLRLGALGAAMTALLALGAATATASTSMAPSLRMRAQAFEQARTRAARLLLAHDRLHADRADRRRPKRRHLRHDHDRLRRPGIRVDARRLAGVGSSRTGGRSRAHDYSFSPQSGITFRYDKSARDRHARYDDRDHSKPDLGRVHGDVGERPQRAGSTTGGWARGSSRRARWRSTHSTS